jgi:hypothetical protein
MFLYSSTVGICDILNWQLGSEMGPIYTYFMHRTHCDQSKTRGLNWTQLIEIAEQKASFQPQCLAMATLKNHRDLERYTCASSIPERLKSSVPGSRAGGEAATVTCMYIHAYAYIHAAH